MDAKVMLTPGDSIDLAMKRRLEDENQDACKDLMKSGHRN